MLSLFDHNSVPGTHGGKKTYSEICGEFVLGKLDEYATHGHRHGHFMESLVAGDLFDCFARGDKQYLDAMPALVKYMYNQLPNGCTGSRERVEAWHEAGGLTGKGFLCHSNGSWLKAPQLNQKMFWVGDDEDEVVKVYSHQETPDLADQIFGFLKDVELYWLKDDEMVAAPVHKEFLPRLRKELVAKGFTLYEEI